MKKIKDDVRNLGSMTYEEIKRSIVRADIKGGERITELGLAEKLGVSRTPVREALRRLDSEGYIYKATSGYVVSKLTKKDVMDILEVRCALESEAARLAAKRITEEEKASLSRNFSRQKELANIESVEERAKRLYQLDIEFHNEILKTAGNNRFIEIESSMRDRLYRSRIASFTSEEDIKAYIDQHRNILNAILSHEVEAAVFYSRDHLLRISWRFNECFPDDY